MRTGNGLSKSVKWNFNVSATGWAGRLDIFGLHQSDGSLAMGTGNFLPQIGRGKLDMPIAQKTDHFQVFGFGQVDGGPAVRAGGLLTKLLPRELDAFAASRTRHFYGFDGWCRSAFVPGNQTTANGQKDNYHRQDYVTDARRYP